MVEDAWNEEVLSQNLGTERSMMLLMVQVLVSHAVLTKEEGCAVKQWIAMNADDRRREHAV